MKKVGMGSGGPTDSLLWEETLCNLEKTLAFFPEDALDETAVLPLFEQMKTICLHELLDYLRAEENEFAPALARVAGGQEKEARLRKKRTQLRESIEEFKAEVALENYVGPQTQPSLLWHLLHGARQLLCSVKEHAALRKELEEEILAAEEPNRRAPQTFATF